MKTRLNALLSDKIHREYPVVEFIASVFGFTLEDLVERLHERSANLHYRLSRDDYNRYIQGLYNGKKNAECTAYEPLQNILQDLLDQLDSDHLHSDGSLLVSMDDRTPVGHFARLKPDFIWSWLPDNRKRKWGASAAGGELRKTLEQNPSDKPFESIVDMERLSEVCTFDYIWCRVKPTVLVACTRPLHAQ